MSFVWNRLQVGPGQSLALGDNGGDLLITGNSAGAMSLSMMQAKIWHLLRVNGPANGFAAPAQQSDFPPATLQSDINVALAQFISDAGLPPSVSDIQRTTQVFALLDMPVPLDLISLSKIEYTLAGTGATYDLIGKSFQEFSSITGGAIYQFSGEPYYYRKIFAGKVRMQPQPGPGQAVNSGQGNIFINGTSTPGDGYTVTIAGGTPSPLVLGYVAVPGDNNQTIAQNIAAIINASLANVFMTAQISLYSGSQIQLFVPSLLAVSYSITTTSTTMNVSPTALSAVDPVGDKMTWYYSSSGEMLLQPGDQPNIPDPFHIALVYRVLADYWLRKNEPNTAELYMKRYEMKVLRAKAFDFDVNKSSQPTIASYDDDDIDGPGVLW